jgi:hypothetical protein
MEVYNNPNVITLESIGILATTVSKFTVVAEGARVKIEWTTSTEQDNERFEIERSPDGINFTKMLTVNGQGYSSSSHNYLAYDEHPLKGNNYYRLVQYNSNGKRTFHGVKLVKFDLLFKPTARVYPNPLTGQSGILLNNYHGSKLQVDIRDMTGKLLLHQSYNTTTGQSYNRLGNLDKLPAGSYLLQLKGNELNEMMKVVVTGK